jgi:uncharacterized protein YcbX
MNSYRISGLYIYPVKSLAGIAMSEVSLCSTGFTHDRRWMLVDAQNRFISQREDHRLCLFTAHFAHEGFIIRYGNDELMIPFEISESESISVTVWDDVVEALMAEPAVNDWFSTRLASETKLVYMPDQSKRAVEEKYSISNNDIVSFADGYPVLTIGEASLALLQSKTDEDIPMNRFRPNLVFTGGNAHDEDNWKQFAINGQLYYGVKPCARCVITTINQQTGTANAEPLKTLATYRNDGNKIFFGQNVISPVSGSIKLGDVITVIKEGK